MIPRFRRLVIDIQVLRGEVSADVPHEAEYLPASCTESLGQKGAHGHAEASVHDARCSAVRLETAASRVFELFTGIRGVKRLGGRIRRTSRVRNHHVVCRDCAVMVCQNDVRYFLFRAHARDTGTANRHWACWKYIGALVRCSESGCT